ncbi:MAG TPA: hypothetical protein VFQ61_06635 [Polyangiaceae bacterium]|nr:hypothetical protein [Polyangiaceae bacterium]
MRRKRVVLPAQIKQWRERQQPERPRLKASIGERVIAKQMDRVSSMGEAL